MWKSAFKPASLQRSLLLYELKQDIKFIRAHLSTSGNSTKTRKWGLAIVGAAVLSAGGAVVYAQRDPDFRKMMKSNIPYGDVIFTYIPDWADKRSSKEADKAHETSLLKLKQERERRQRIEKKSETAAPPIAAPPPPAFDFAAPAVSKVLNEETRKVDLKRETEREAKALNTALETKLRESRNAVESLYRDTSTAQQFAINAIKEHAELLFRVLDENQDSNNESLWDDVRLAQEAKISALAKVTEAVIDLRSAIDRAQGHITEAKSTKATSNNGELLGAEENIQKISQQLKTMEEQLVTAQTESQAASLFKELIEKGKDQLQNELEAILPSDFKGRKLNEEELNLVLGHAHRRLRQLQHQLAKQEATEKLRVRLAMENMHNKQEATIEEHISRELLKQKRNLESEQLNKEAKLRESFELEMRQQLRRQAAAHSDHLHEALAVKETELDRQNSLKCQESLLKQQGDHQEQVGNSMSRLKGIQHYLQAREELEKASRKAQQLWLACQALRQTVRFGITGRDTSESVLHPLKNQVSSIKEAAVGSSDPLYETIISSIPEAALERGVFTEEALRKRFGQIEKTCKRLAMLENENSPAEISLYRYLLSYLRSFLIIDAFSSSIADSQLDSEVQGKVVVEPSKWSTGDILARTKACLDRRELEQALRYCSQLKGEPARAARDWILEARLALETRQAADALMAQAAGITVQAYH